MNHAQPKISPETVQRLLLARLLVPVKKPLSRERLEKDVAGAITPPLSAADAKQAAATAFEACLRAGYLDVVQSARAPARLSTAGRQALPALLGLSAVPAIKTWAHGQQLAAARGLAHPEAAAAQLDADQLAAQILTSQHGLPRAKTAASAVDRLAWKTLGVDRDKPFTALAVQRYLLRELVPEDARVKPEVWRRMLAMRALGGAGHDAKALTRALLTAAPDGGSERVHNDNAGARIGAPSLADFARAVREAALKPEVARFDDERAFIGSIWEHMRGQSPIGDMSLADFKAQLIAAHRNRHLRITRADLVAAMDPAEVQRSEARFQDATFHFVELDAGGAR